MKELKYKKNSKFEIEFTNLDEIKEGDNVILRLQGDLTPIMILSLCIDNDNFNGNNFLIANIDDNLIQQIEAILEPLIWRSNVFYFFDKNIPFDLTYHSGVNFNTHFKNILPKWNIPENNAILFLNEKDKNKYTKVDEYNDYSYYTYPNLEDAEEGYSISDYDKISIILPELHSEDKSCKYHIENINKVCKELKEKYRVAKIELFVSHCFIKRKYKYTRCAYSSYELDYKFDNWNKYDFDLKKDFNNKLIETNSFIPIVRETIVNDNTIEFKVEKEYELTKSIKCEKDCKCNKLELSAVGLMTIDDFNPLHDNGEEFNYGDYIDKITTTNSTGVLEIQKSDKLEVIDVIEFFKN